MIILKSEREIERMRNAGRLVAQAHEAVKRAIEPGITTGELDRIVEQLILAGGGIPTFKGYQGFPASICTSVNDEVVHGIPGDRVLKSGDIVAVDIGVTLDGYVGDSAWTYPVGEVSEEAQRLLRVTEEALYRGIEQFKSGNRLSDISHAIQQHAEANGLGIVRQYVGHGVGRSMHEAPQLPNFGPPGRGPRLGVGWTLAIEPMLNLGTDEVRTDDDGWTVRTEDGSLSAHFEHTVAITKNGQQILTIL